MKRIKKKITLEQFKSRMPSIISAYKDGVEYEFIDKTDRYSVNYNMIPKNIVINGKSVCYNTLSDWYHFMDEYGDIVTKFNSAEEYYNSNEVFPLYSLYKCEEIFEKYNEIKSHIGTNFDLMQYFPYFVLPNNKIDSWKCKKLSIPDAMKWYKWFIYNKDSKDCCIKEKYNKLYYNDIINDLKIFLDSYRDISIEYKDTYINIPLVIQNSISNMGEFTYYDDEKYYEPNIEYTELSDIKFSYKNNKMIESPTHRKMSESYDIIYKLCCLINNVLYLAEENECIEYKGKLYKVNYLNSKPFVTIYGKRYYAKYSNSTYYFSLSQFNDPCLIDDNQKYFITNKLSIIWNNDLYEVINKTINLPIGEYKLADGYVIIDSKPYMIIKNGWDSYIANIVLNKDDITFGLKLDIIDDEQNEDFNEYNYFIDTIYENKVYIIQPYNVYSLLKVTGSTESKIDSFMVNDDIVYDNMGNKLQGTYGKKTASDIVENCYLDLIYRPNTIYDISKDSDTSFWGNLLTEMKFYYTDVFGNEVLSSTLDINDAYNGVYCLDIINELKNKLENYNYTDDFVYKHNTIDTTLKCDITYYIGCELNISKPNGNTIKYELGGYKGIKYTDTYQLELKQEFYQIDGMNSIIVNYYDLTYDEISYKNGNNSISLKKSNFEYEIQPLDYDKENIFIFKEEHKMRASSIEKVDADIYIQRGLSKSIDSHLKLLEVKSLDSLTKYGNHQFNIEK